MSEQLHQVRYFTFTGNLGSPQLSEYLTRPDVLTAIGFIPGWISGLSLIVEQSGHYTILVPRAADLKEITGTRGLGFDNNDMLPSYLWRDWLSPSAWRGPGDRVALVESSRKERFLDLIGRVEGCDNTNTHRYKPVLSGELPSP